MMIPRRKIVAIEDNTGQEGLRPRAALSDVRHPSAGNAALAAVQPFEPDPDPIGELLAAEESSAPLPDETIHHQYSGFQASQVFGGDDDSTSEADEDGYVESGVVEAVYTHEEVLQEIEQLTAQEPAQEPAEIATPEEAIAELPQETEPVAAPSYQVKSAFQDEEYRPQPEEPDREIALDGGELGIENPQYKSNYKVERPGFHNVGNPIELTERLAQVGYQCLNFLAVQMSLLLNTPTTKIRALLLEGPSGCGKTFMAKSLAKIVGAELMCLSCYEGMITANLIEYPSTLAMANVMAGKGENSPEALMNLGIISRAFQKSRTQPVILLIDELDKTSRSIDTFFLGPIQDARIWLESREPIDANPQNLLVVFTKNYNRTLDEAFLRRCHPIKMTYLDSTLEKKILSPHCHPQLVANLVAVADRMRNSGGSYAFERPPAPEELLTAALYVSKLLEWGINDFNFVGKNIWAILAKSDHDRAVLEHMMRFHPDFMDPLIADGRDASLDDVYGRLGRIVLFNIVDDPDKERRERAWEEIDNY